MTIDNPSALWTDARWHAEVTSWIRDQLAHLELHIVGDIEQPHVRPWSTVLRVPTSEGDVFFKACAPVLVHEVAVTEALVKWVPDRLPSLLAADAGRGWMLMADGGSTVREHTKADGDIRHWVKLLPRYADLQIAVNDRVDELVALGLPDRRLAVLPGRIEKLLDDDGALLIGQEEGLTVDQFARLKGMGPELVETCERLSTYGVPESVHHGDFHDANAFYADGEFLVFDWGDASATHPFCSLRTSFVSLYYVLGLDDGAPELDQLRDAYLKPFERYASSDRLLDAFRIAHRLSSLVSALSWYRSIAALPLEERGDYAGAVPGLLKEFLELEDQARSC